MSEHVVVPTIHSNIAEQAKRTKTVQEYNGIYANLLTHYILTDVIKNMSIGSKCDDNQLSTMIANTISVQAAQRSV